MLIGKFSKISKQSQYGRYFPRAIDDSIAFAPENIRLRPGEEKQKKKQTKKKKKLIKKTIILGEKRPYHTNKDD